MTGGLLSCRGVDANRARGKEIWRLSGDSPQSGKAMIRNWNGEEYQGK